MINSTTQSCSLAKGIPIKSLRFIPSCDNKFISVYAQYSKSEDWVPINIGMSSIPTLQQIRDVDRNISLNTGSYTDAHFYIRSAEGNNATTAFYTNAAGGAIQSGNISAYIPLNLQPLGGLLTYGGAEIATKAWVQSQGSGGGTTPTLQQVATAGKSFNGDLTLGSAGNELFVGAGPAGSGIENTRLGKNTFPSLILGKWNTAVGSNALTSMKYGLNNVAIGEVAMADFIGVLDSFSNNTAIGDATGVGMTQGVGNVIVGASAGYCGGSLRPRGDRNTFIGTGAGNASTIAAGTTTLGSYNIFMGWNAGGGPVDSLLSNQLRIGNINNFTTDKHIIAGTMAQGAQALTFNASVTVPTLSGGGNRMVYVDNNGTFLASKIPSDGLWVNTGTNSDSQNISGNWITPDSSYGFEGVHTGGGLGTAYNYCIGEGTYRVIDKDHIIICDTNRHFMELPDPNSHDGREIQFIISQPMNGGKPELGQIVFSGAFIPKFNYMLNSFTNMDQYTFPSVSSSPPTNPVGYAQDSTLNVKSIFHPAYGQHFWVIIAQGAIR